MCSGKKPVDLCTTQRIRLATIMFEVLSLSMAKSILTNSWRCLIASDFFCNMLAKIRPLEHEHV